MSYLDTPHKRKSFTITVLLLLLLLLVLYLVKFSIDQEEYDGGIAVNFGQTEYGSGDQQPLEPVRTEPDTPTEEVEETETTPQEVVEDTTSAVDEDVTTQDTEDAPVIEKKEEKKPTEIKEVKEEVEDAKPIEKETPKPVEKKPDASTKSALDSFLKGPKSDGANVGGEGNDAVAGDKGKPDGDPNAKSYYGTGKGLDGDGNYRLGGRKALNKEKNVPECNETGDVVVRITVNQAGKVIKAVPGIKGSTNTAPCLLAPAKKAALATNFNSDPNAPSIQVGEITYSFKLSE